MYFKDVTYGEYFVNETNWFGNTTANIIVEHYQSNYNPLWILGPKACGKTHLANEIFKRFKAAHKNISVGYMFARELMSLFNNHLFLGANKLDADVIIFEDADYFFDKPKLLTKFINLLVEKVNNKQQIIVTSTSFTNKTMNIRKRLNYKFDWILYADLKMPNYYIKQEYIKEKLEQMPLDITKNAIEYLAENITYIPLINEIFTSAKDYHKKTGKKITLDWMRKAVLGKEDEYSNRNS